MIWTRYFTSAILNRGRIYWNNGRVGKLQMPDDETCTAVVRGTHSYHVSARLLPNDKLELDCDCPYAEDGNHCKHEAALLYEIEDEKPALHTGMDRIPSSAMSDRMFCSTSPVPTVYRMMTAALIIVDRFVRAHNPRDHTDLNTIEEKILLLQKDKSNLADEILSGSVQGIGSLSREALMEILS